MFDTENNMFCASLTQCFVTYLRHGLLGTYNDVSTNMQTINILLNNLLRLKAAVQETDQEAGSLGNGECKNFKICAKGNHHSVTAIFAEF
jgi:hypothetical protein